MEAETTLIWSDSVVELYTISGICLNITIVINPSNTECKHSVRLHEALDNSCILEFRMFVIHILDAFKHFTYSLEVLFLRRILGLESGHYFFCSHRIINYWLYNQFR